jgi:hypothetical protein
MHHAVQKLVLLMLMLTVLPSSAELAGTDPTGLSLSTRQAAGHLTVVPASAEFANSDMAKVVTHYSRAEDCLAALAITRIDAETVAVPAQGFLIAPGVHTINGRATLDITHCPFTDSDQKIVGAAALAVNFEAGKTYYIGYDYKSANTVEWSLVVWKIE